MNQLEELTQLINIIRQDPECKVNDPQGIPNLEVGHVLPVDVQHFYRLTGGISLFPNTEYACTILIPEQVSPTWRNFFDKDFLDTFEVTDIEPLLSLYGIVSLENNERLSIDCSEKRLGYCYDTFHETFVGDNPLIAYSLTELLTKLYESRGNHWFWLKEGFSTLGNSHDSFN